MKVEKAQKIDTINLQKPKVPGKKSFGAYLYEALIRKGVNIKQIR